MSRYTKQMHFPPSQTEYLDGMERVGAQLLNLPGIVQLGYGGQRQLVSILLMALTGGAG